MRRARVARRTLSHTRVVTSTSRPTAPGPRPAGDRPAPRKRSRKARFAPLAIVALAAFGVGAFVGLRHESAEAAVARQWAAAWERGDYPAMHALLSDRARSRAKASSASFAPTAKPPRRSRSPKVRADTPCKARRRGATTCRFACRPGSSGAWRDGCGLPMTERGGRRGRRLARAARVPRAARRRAAAARDDAGRARRDPRPRRHAAGEGPGPALGPRAARGRGRRARRPGAAGARGGARPPRRPEGAPVGLNGLEREFDERLSGSPAASCAPARG